MTFMLPEGRWDLFDSVEKQIVAEGAEGSAVLTLGPGQAAVFYDGDSVVGGGTIAEVLTEKEHGHGL